MGTDGAAGRHDLVRRAVVPLAAAIALLTVTTDPGNPAEAAALAVAVAAFAAWARWPRTPGPVLAVAVLAPVVLAQLGGALEPAMFLVSLLALAVAGWTPVSAGTVAAGLAAVASPVLLGALQPAEDRIAASIWVVGIAFPWLMGALIHRQERLAAELDAARRELADRALAEERRRIARDVHDLVGHGLASMLMQVTSAQHVLRRDPDAAAEALAAAGEVGRRSMAELRGTVAMLRGGPAEGARAAVPAAADIARLVDAARADGLDIDYRVSGDLSRLDGATGVALYRIAQEALTNAARHAPDARTVLCSRVEGAAAVLEVTSTGPLRPGNGAGFGVLGMRERAEVAGGELHAGPTPAGWLVRARVPIDRSEPG